jgi:hypothetical protein
MKNLLQIIQYVKKYRINVDKKYKIKLNEKILLFKINKNKMK